MHADPVTLLESFVQSAPWPVMPEVGRTLIQTLDDEDADSAIVCRIIRSDPALSATLMRMANSAMFGQSGTVDTVERAVADDLPDPQRWADPSALSI